ncbi:MAG: response regulator [Oscillospiraceae bacterium]|nr:response regulator [Oscillospiraceae bacterium]
MLKPLIAIEPMPHGRVLVVDDTDFNIFVAKRLMEPYGLTITSVSGGGGAIEKISGGAVYDIIFMDYVMPGMDGLETTKRLRAMGYTGPIVAFTATSKVGQTEVFLSSGFNGFITKPINANELDAMLKKYIAGKNAPGPAQKGSAEKRAVKGGVRGPAGKPTAKTKKSTNLTKQTKRNSVLLVDDDSLNITELTRILSPDYTIYAATDGQSAVLAVEKHWPDLILLDIIMPDIDGYAIISALKNFEKTKDIPVIFITSLDSANEEEKGLALGASDYISKPFNPAIVKLRVRNQLQIQNQLRTIQETLVSLEEASNAKAAFLAGMSHEVRTPMNAIIGMSQLLLGEELNSRHREYVGDINRSAYLLLDSLNGLIDMSAIESGKLAPAPRDYDFGAFMKNIADMFGASAKNKGLDFTYETGGALPKYLFGDDAKLRQILMNLCSNAVKFTEKGGIGLKVFTVGGSLVFEVKDTGMGIRGEDIPGLFTAFSQTEKHKNRGQLGIGLGLAIAKSFVDMMGGEMRADSVYGEGSAFTVMLPIVPGSGDNISDNPTGGKENTAPALYAPDARVLVVDDNDFNLKIARGLLELFGVSVTTASSGQEAIKLVKQGAYDIIFMDYMMPEMDGIEAASEIRKLGGDSCRIPIVALTANAVPGAREMFLENGFDEYISKPIEMSVFNEALAKRLPEDKIKPVPKNRAPARPGTDRDSAFLELLGGVGEINTELGLGNVSGMEDLYRDALGLFCAKIVPVCERMDAFLDSGEIGKFAVDIHGMKSVLATVGAADLSAAALEMELAAKGGGIRFCREKYPAFKQSLLSVHSRLAVIFSEEETAVAEKEKGDAAFLGKSVQAALDAAAEFDDEAGTEALKSITAYTFGKGIDTLLGQAMEAFNGFNCDRAASILSEIQYQLKKEMDL